MDHEKDAFYVVKKGDIIGVCKCLDDCQALLGSSVCDPPVTVFKGYGLPKEAEDYLVSNGLKNAVYSVAATAVQDRLFGQLSVCKFQEPSSSKRKALDQYFPNKRLKYKLVVPTSVHVTPQNKHVDFQNCIHIPSVFCSDVFCSLEFDGASRGNPGPSGAGAVLRIEVESATRVYRLREGVGFATNSVAEYRGLLLGLNYALQKGYKYIGVQGNSKLVVTQDLNTAADAQAKLAIDLKNGDFQVECETI